jgi:FMN reductase (NADPH)
LLEDKKVNSITIELINKHGSVRQYKPDPVPSQMVQQIIAAGQHASTSSNLQMYSVVAVTDVARREQMSALCGNQLFIKEAPVFLAWCADLSRLERASAMYGRQQVSNYAENFLLATVDVSLFMQTTALAAESLGLGICYVGAIRNQPQDVINLLQLPKLVFPISGMAVGWPVRPPRIRPRLPLDAVLHWETYSTANEEQHFAEYDEAMIATGIYKGRHVSAAGEEEVQVYGWTEHSTRRASHAVRTGLKEVLAQQGYKIE